MRPVGEKFIKFNDNGQVEGVAVVIAVVIQELLIILKGLWPFTGSKLSPPVAGIFDGVQKLRDEIVLLFLNLNHNPTLLQSIFGDVRL